MIGLHAIYPLQDGNKLVYSSVTWCEDGKRSTPSFSIKYAHAGTEQYEVTGTEYKVTEGDYLLIAPGESFSTYVNAPVDVKGLCIDINADILAAVGTAMISSDKQLLDAPGRVDNSCLLPGLSYKTRNGRLGSALHQLADWGGRDELLVSGTSFFYSLAEILLAEQAMMAKSMWRLPAAKAATRKELFKRLLTAKEIMEEEYTSPLCIQTLAKAAFLSPFHFIRSFQQVFGLSPHQYLLQKRLALSQRLLLDSSHSVNDIALLCGFANAPQFVSLFKKRFGTTPMKFRQVVRSCL